MRWQLYCAALLFVLALLVYVSNDQARVIERQREELKATAEFSLWLMQSWKPCAPAIPILPQPRKRGERLVIPAYNADLCDYGPAGLRREACVKRLNLKA